jgi:hypothetical protein
MSVRLLKLIALDEDDLKVIAAHVQDAVVSVGEMAWLPKEHRFAALLSRFDWEVALEGKADESGPRRRRSALRFDRVLGAQIMNLNPNARRDALELLTILFEPGEPPEGHVTLIFAGDAAVRLHVECIEAELRDLGGAWRAGSVPRHDLGDGDDSAPEAQG